MIRFVPITQPLKSTEKNVLTKKNFKGKFSLWPKIIGMFLYSLGKIIADLCNTVKNGN